MNRDVFEQRLASLPARQPMKLRALVDEYRNDLAGVYRLALLNLPAGGAHAHKAVSLMAQLEETATAALGGVLAGQKPVPDTALLMDLSTGFGAAEKAVLDRLKSAVSDGRMVPRPREMGPVEEQGPRYRDCDEAYVALRRILHSESLLQHAMEARHFLALPETDKNREIESWRRSAAFTRYLDDVDLDD